MLLSRVVLSFLCIGIIANATAASNTKNISNNAIKEIQLIVEKADSNNETASPINVHYKFYSGKAIYAQGKLDNIVTGVKRKR